MASSVNLTNFQTADPAIFVTKLVPLIIDGRQHPTIKFDILSNHLIDQDYSIVSHKFPELVGCDYALRYDLGQYTLPGQIQSFRLAGDMPMASKWKAHTAPPVLKLDNDRGLEAASRFMEEFGIATKGSSFHSQQMDSASYIFASATIPPGLLNYDELENYILWAVFFFHLDDIMDNTTDLRTEEFRPMETVACLDFLCEALHGEPFNEERMTQAKNLPKLKPLWDIFADFRRRLLKQSQDEEEWKLTIYSLIEWVEASAWEQEGWSCPDSSKWNSDIYWVVRDAVLGYLPSLEIVALSAHIRITPKMRRDPLLRYLMKLWSRLTTLANDIFSLPKEIDKEELNNYFFISARAGAGKSGDAVLHEIQTQVFPQMIREVRLIEKRILLKFNNDPTLSLFLDCGKRIYEGLALWSCVAKRYEVPCRTIHVAFFTQAGDSKLFG